MPWHLLRSFVRVVEAGSVRRAAKALYLAPSAVSTHVSTLASSLGAPLLERRDGVLVPTALGTALCEGARDLLQRAEELDRRLRSLADRRRPLRIVSASRPGQSAIGVLAARFARVQPDAALSLRVVDDAGAAEAALHRGIAHVAVLDRDAVAESRAAIELGEETVVLAVPPHHRWTRRRAVDLGELADQPFVLPPPGSEARRFLTSRLGAELARIAPVLETDDDETVAAALGGGLANAFLVAARAQRLGFPAVRVRGADLARRFALVRADGEPDLMTARFWTWCAEAARSAAIVRSA